MNVEISLIIGLLVGLVYATTRRVLATSRLKMAGGAMLLKWGHGVGRASVLEVQARTMRLSSPVMRQNFTPPEPGSELLIKPLGGGPVQRAKFLAHGESGWTVRLA